MNIPTNLLYTKSHEWVAFTDETETAAKIGLTDFAQKSLGGIVFVNLPMEGDEIEAGASLGDVESVKAVADVVSPLGGVVSAVNEALADAPEMINDDPYAAWLVSVSDVTAREELLDAAAYETLVKESN